MNFALFLSLFSLVTSAANLAVTAVLGNFLVRFAENFRKSLPSPPATARPGGLVDVATPQVGYDARFSRERLTQPPPAG